MGRSVEYVDPTRCVPLPQHQLRMFVQVRHTRRAQLVREHDDMRHAKLSQVLQGGAFGKRVERCGLANVELGREARIAVQDWLPEAGRGQHTVDVLGYRTGVRKWEAG